eukprot:INCI1746.1.p1 GENE.INCI1746.1~~INCI1746.1.p1  ORF type:complete len:1319 (-),score=172.32 INCI1746.1:288-3875(-)
MNEAAERRRHYHESVSRWQRFLHHSLKNPQPVSRVRMLRAIESKKLRSRGREDAPVEIVFVRHCEGNHNAMKSVGMGTYPDASLTHLGVEQGLTTGAILEDVRFDFIVTSPMTRCLETCILLCQHASPGVKLVGAPCPVIVCPEAREYCYGNFAIGNMGSSPAVLERRFWNYQALFDLSAVESCDDLLDEDSLTGSSSDSSSSGSDSEDSELIGRNPGMPTSRRVPRPRRHRRRVIPRVKPLPDDWCPIEAEWQFQHRCDRFRRWLGRRFPPGSKVLVISHGFVFRSAFPGEGKIFNGEFRHFYIDRDGGFFSVKESLIRNIAFRETYNSIKTGISTPSSSVSLPKGQKAGAESGKGSGKRKTKKNGRSNTVATGAGSDVGDSGVGGPQFPPAEALAPLCYVPDIDLGFDGRDDDDDWNTVSRSAFGAADIEESEQNEPEKRITPKFADNESSKMGPLARRFFSASSFSRSDVLVLSLQCLVGSSASLREIREACKQSGEYGVMSAPAVVVNSWFGGGPQVYRYKSFFEKLAAFGFQVVVLSEIPAVYTWVLLGRMGLVPTLNLQISLMQLIEDYKGIEKLLNLHLYDPASPKTTTIDAFSNVIVCGVAGGPEGLSHKAFDRVAAVQDILATQCGTADARTLRRFLYVDPDPAVLDKLHRAMELRSAETAANLFQGPLDHQKNERFTFRCHSDGPLSLQEMQDILKIMMTIDEETPAQIASFAHLDNDDDGGLRLASQSQGTFETPLRRSRADSANSIRHALCGRQPLPTNVLSHAKPSSQSLLSIVKAPSSLVQDTALNWESQGEESGVWKEARTEMSMEEIVDFVQGVNTRAKVIQKRRAIKRAKGDKNTTHNMAGASASWGFKAFFVDLSSFSLLYRSTTANPFGFKRIETMDANYAGFNFKRLQLGERSRIFARTDLKIKTNIASPWNPTAGSQGIEFLPQAGEIGAGSIGRGRSSSASSAGSSGSSGNAEPVVTASKGGTASSITPEVETETSEAPISDISGFIVVEDIDDPTTTVWYLRPNTAAGPDRATWMAALRTIVRAATAVAHEKRNSELMTLDCDTTDGAGSSQRPRRHHRALHFPPPIPVLTATLGVYYAKRFMYKPKSMTLRQHAVGGVMTYEREAGKGYHTLWLGAATRVEVPTKKGARDTDFSIESMGVGPWWVRCSSSEERHAWIACIRMIIGRGNSLQ